MTNPGPTKEKYDSLIYKLAIPETQLKQARKLLEAPAKAGWWKRFWGRGSKAVVALVVVFVGVGCATLSNIQESPPLMVFDSTYSPEKVANCIVDKGTQAGLDQSRFWSVGWAPPTLKKSGDDYRILVVGVAANPLAELSIKPSGTGSHIEVKATWWISRDKFLEVIEKCAKDD